jgi:hypothetical protein
MNDITIMLLSKITTLATSKQQPLIILENPKYAALKASQDRNPSQWPDYLLASIGNVSVSFDGYSINELTELYAELKAGIEAEETYKKAHEVGYQSAKQAYAKSPQ